MIENYTPYPSRRASCLLACLLFYVFGASVLIGAGRASADPLSVVANPATNLLDAQYTNISWSGSPPNSGIQIAQCAEVPGSIADCAPVAKISRSSASGTGEKQFQVKTGDFPAGFSCDSDKPCSIGVFWGTLGQAPVFSQGSFAKIQFGHPLSSCPLLGDPQVAGTGSSGGYLAMLHWEAEVCREPHSLNVQYTVKNSVDGLDDFALGFSDYGMSALPMTADHVEIPDPPRAFVSIPATLSGVSFAYTIFDRVTGAQINNLKLTPKLVAEIFTGQLLNLSLDDRDDGIKKLNPGINFPSRIKAVGRADKSASTFYMTSWFQATAKEAYEAGGNAFKGGAVDIYPSTGQTTLLTGGETVAKAVGPQADPDVATIGWMDSSWAAFYGISMAAVPNVSGAFKTPFPESLAAGAEAARAKHPDGFPEPDFTTDSPVAYPLPVINHLYLPTTIDRAKGTMLKSFANFMLADGQGLLPPGYAPLPEPFVTASQGAIDRINPPEGTVTAAGSEFGSKSASAGDAGTAGQTETETDAEQESDGSPATASDSQPSGFGGSTASDRTSAPALAASQPRTSRPAATLIKRVAQILGKAGLLGESAAWMIFPGLVIAGVAGLITGPAVAIPAWTGTESGAELRKRLRGLYRR